MQNLSLYQSLPWFTGHCCNHEMDLTKGEGSILFWPFSVTTVAKEEFVFLAGYKNRPMEPDSGRHCRRPQQLFHITYLDIFNHIWYLSARSTFYGIDSHILHYHGLHINKIYAYFIHLGHIWHILHITIFDMFIDCYIIMQLSMTLRTMNNLTWSRKHCLSCNKQKRHSKECFIQNKLVDLRLTKAWKVLHDLKL